MRVWVMEVRPAGGFPAVAPSGWHTVGKTLDEGGIICILQGDGYTLAAPPPGSFRIIGSFTVGAGNGDSTS